MPTESETIREIVGPDCVISAGMDIYSEDPLGTIKVTTEGIGEIGKRIASLGLPAVVVMEGGYANEMLGTNVLRFLGELK